MKRRHDKKKKLEEEPLLLPELTCALKKQKHIESLCNKLACYSIQITNLFNNLCQVVQ